MHLNTPRIYKMNADKKHRDDNNQENVRQSQAPRAKVSVRVLKHICIRTEI